MIIKEYKVIAHKQLRTKAAILKFNVRAEDIRRAREVAFLELNKDCPIFSIEYTRDVTGSEFELKAFCSNDDDIGQSKVITVEADTYDEARGVGALKFYAKYDNVVLTQVRKS